MPAIPTTPSRHEADELLRLRAEVAALRAQVGTLTRQRDHYAEQLKEQWLAFAPAHRLYEGFGFADCGPFADYTPDPNSRFFTLSLL
ncbi:MAG: hypothetical protein MUF18_13605 [Fimbriiglobus sp.]|jgi:hypothetical protein|nr:hypothetical protein [Fimbriiglobus sp.]